MAKGKKDDDKPKADGKPKPKKSTANKSAAKKSAAKKSTAKSTPKKSTAKADADPKPSQGDDEAVVEEEVADKAADKPSDKRTGPMYPGWEQLGEFIRAQRKMMELSQRELAKLTKVSDPYVSQLERGLHEPSVRVIKSLADALNVRAETLLGYAGLLDSDSDSDSGADAAAGVESAIQADPHLSNDQKQTLLSVYRNFRGPIEGS